MGPIDLAQLLQDVQSELGFENAVPLTQGGQKLVLQGELSGNPGIAKVVILPAGPSQVIALERAHREVELLAAVDSRHVVKVLTDAIELGNPPTVVCWVEERLDGVDLTALLTRKWSESEVWTLLSDIGAGLKACHDLDVVHRDLSPGNIRQVSTGDYVLMDPGLARHLARTAITGQFQPGTQGWRSPEHVPGGRPVPASDIYVVGLLAYYALTGTHAIDPTGPDDIYNHRLAHTSAPSVAALRPDVTAKLADLIDRCLSRQSARRFLDGTELLDEIAKGTAK